MSLKHGAGRNLLGLLTETYFLCKQIKGGTSNLESALLFISDNSLWTCRRVGAAKIRGQKIGIDRSPCCLLLVNPPDHLLKPEIVMYITRE